MWKLLGREPKSIYHFTHKNNVESIKLDRQLKKFKDTYVFVCESYEDCITVLKNTFLNPDAKYIDFDGLIKKYSNKNINDYVILELKTRHSQPIKWYISESSATKEIDDITLAYKGNLPINFINELEIKI